MSRPTLEIVIDARPRGDAGLLADARILGRPVIEHLVDLAEGLGAAAPVAIHARQDEHARIAALLDARPSSRYRLALGPPPESASILRTDRLYDPARLRRALRRGRETESAVIWRIDRPHALAAAGDELTKRTTYQPLGRFWAARPATALGRVLAPTVVRPNHLTIASATLMLTAAGLVATFQGTWLGQVVPALAMALALILDTADGHLARLQGTASEFGRWLDANLDELGDLALHAAIAWAAFARTGQPGWLAVGVAYASAKYLFVFGTMAAPTVRPSTAMAAGLVRPGVVRRLTHLAAHADVRWHLWIALAAVGRLEWALAAYASYFAARALGGAARKAAAHAA